MEASIEQVRSLYLDLMKRVLVNWIYGAAEWETTRSTGLLDRLARAQLLRDGAFVGKRAPFDQDKRARGLDWPPFAHSMIGLKRLDNLQDCLVQAIVDKIPGDFIETGVWRGGATIFARAVFKAYGVTDRTVWVADSFEGLPKPDSVAYPADEGDVHHSYDDLRVSLEDVKENFRSYGLLDDQVQFLKGWFRDTLPTAPIDKLAVLRLDGDMYESTIVALKSLYPRLSIGGYLIVDDYCIPSCAKAVHDFRNENRISDEIVEIDGTGVFWRRRG